MYSLSNSNANLAKTCTIDLILRNTWLTELLIKKYSTLHTFNNKSPNSELPNWKWPK